MGWRWFLGFGLDSCVNNGRTGRQCTRWWVSSDLHVQQGLHYWNACWRPCLLESSLGSWGLGRGSTENRAPRSTMPDGRDIEARKHCEKRFLLNWTRDCPVVWTSGGPSLFVPLLEECVHIFTLRGCVWGSNGSTETLMPLTDPPLSPPTSWPRDGPHRYSPTLRSVCGFRGSPHGGGKKPLLSQRDHSDSWRPVGRLLRPGHPHTWAEY